MPLTQREYNQLLAALDTAYQISDEGLDMGDIAPVLKTFIEDEPTNQIAPATRVDAIQRVIDRYEVLRTTPLDNSDRAALVAALEIVYGSVD